MKQPIKHTPFFTYKRLAIIITALLFANCKSNNKKPANDTLKYLLDVSEKNQSAAVVMIQVKGNGSEITSLGFADKEKYDKVTESTLFEIGSVTKVFTAALAQMYVEKGIINWNDDLVKALPGVPLKINDSTTLKNLVSHTSGFPALPAFFTDSMPPTINPYATVSEEKMVRYLASFNDKEKPSFTNYNYSNFGMGLLGYLLTKKTGKDFETLIKDEICTPLDMHHTGIKVSDTAPFAKGYDAKGILTPYWGLGAIEGSGALRSNGEDMVKFLKACLPGGKLNRIMNVLQQPLAKTPDGWGCYGWKKMSIENTGDIFWHVGGTGGFRSYIGICNEKKTGIVVLVNQAIDKIDEIGKKLLLMLLQ
jgi:serine-type D-Ala-D-Ala carboxypeptidase/endopeptidase